LYCVVSVHYLYLFSGVEWTVPHLSAITHPSLERLRYPRPEEPVTDEFRTYAYYALMEEPDSENLFYMMKFGEGEGSSAIFNSMLEYAKFYQLWRFDWSTIVETFLEMAQRSPGYAPGYKPFEEHHVVPLKEEESKSYEKQVWKAARKDRESVENWAGRNKEEAIRYLRSRRHHGNQAITISLRYIYFFKIQLLSTYSCSIAEHDRRYNAALPAFGLAPPAGMERIARSQIECKYTC